MVAEDSAAVEVVLVEDPEVLDPAALAVLDPAVLVAQDPVECPWAACM